MLSRTASNTMKIKQIGQTRWKSIVTMSTRKEWKTNLKNVSNQEHREICSDI